MCTAHAWTCRADCLAASTAHRPAMRDSQSSSRAHAERAAYPRVLTAEILRVRRALRRADAG